ncbi:MAG: Phosphate-binding protein PstS 1 precursor [Syntrophorhabdus sp. PtaB.Bin184]|nr:MAG: Phosphate-binding protein PstS 1 precursor [Syntrophorhabdus sp. PtaB.Bin184]
MSFRHWVILLPLIAALISCSAASNDKPGKKHTITIAGSTSVMPFTEKLAEHFMVDHKNFIVDVQGGGSTAGIQAVINNTVELGMSSRPLKNEEKRLNTITICYDGIAVVVHPDNPVGDLDLDRIRQIFSGRISNWRELGWVDRRIDAVSREEGSGTRGAFEDLVMKGNEIDDGTMVQDSNGSVKEVVATDPYAIGYISMGLVDKKVKPVAIAHVSPSIKTIKSGRYKLVRPFLYVTNGELDTKSRRFVDYVLSKEGQQILRNEGLVGFYD